MRTIDYNSIIKQWASIPHIIKEPENEEEYKILIDFIEQLLLEIDDNNNPLLNLLEVISILIDKYEEDHYLLPEASGIEILSFLIEEHGLKQCDLKEIGSQGVVSEVLNGKRELTTKQIKKLSDRFNVSPAVFF